MKYFIAVLALSVFGQDGLAFSVQKGNAFRSSSSLYMAVEEKEQKMVKVGVIGCGRIGLVHLEAITKAPGVTPVIVSNPTVSKAEAGEICFDPFCCWHLLRSVIKNQIQKYSLFVVFIQPPNNTVLRNLLAMRWM